MSSNQDKTARQWISEAEEALNRTGDALKTAWSETREARMATLEAAREAASRLGKAIDEGIEAARKSWDSSQGGGTTYSESANTGTEPSTAAALDQEEE
jgi:ElaB/YqjD/DUF883 family membrane-anchored ribosome-binding protein